LLVLKIVRSIFNSETAILPAEPGQTADLILRGRRTTSWSSAGAQASASGSNEPCPSFLNSCNWRSISAVEKARCCGVSWPSWRGATSVVPLDRAQCDFGFWDTSPARCAGPACWHPAPSTAWPFTLEIHFRRQTQNLSFACRILERGKTNSMRSSLAAVLPPLDIL